jgi:hypothetical protein
MNCTGRGKALVSVGGERRVETYSVQSAENWMEDFGSGQSQNGVAVVTIDAAFAETVTGNSTYHVFFTPNGDSKSLYVISKLRPRLKCGSPAAERRRSVSTTAS